MKTILNKTHEPVRVPLPRGKVLHLGPNKSGQIAHTDLDHPPLQKLIADEVIQVQDAESGGELGHDADKGRAAETHGFHPPTGTQRRGDR